MTGKHVVSGLSIFLVLMVGVVIGYSWQEDVPAPAELPPLELPQASVQMIVPTPTTVTGLPVCLPHKNPDSPQTEECSLGLRTDTGEYYALNFERMSAPRPDVSRGEIITLAGELTPLPRTGADRWETYAASQLFFAASVIEAPALLDETTELQ